MVHDVGEVVVLSRDGPEVPHRLVRVRVGAGVAEGFAELVGLDLRIGLGHRRVAHDGAAQPAVVPRRRGDRHEATHAVADDHGRAVDTAGIGGGHHFLGPLLE